MKCSNCSNFGWTCQGGVGRFMSLGFVKKITFHPCKKLPATQLNLMIHLLFFYVFLLSFGKIRFCPGNKVVLSNSGLPLNSNVQYRDDHTKIYHILSDSHSIPITYPIILLIPIYIPIAYIYPWYTHAWNIFLPDMRARCLFPEAVTAQIGLMSISLFCGQRGILVAVLLVLLHALFRARPWTVMAKEKLKGY